MTTKETLQKARDILLEKARTAHQHNDAWVVATLAYTTQSLDNAVKYVDAYPEWQDSILAEKLPEIVMAEGIIKAVENADLFDGE